MGVNRIANTDGKPDEQPVSEVVHLLHTPLGVVKVIAKGSIDGQTPDALGEAIQTFHTVLESGAEDPLAQALCKLKDLAVGGAEQPLHAGLALLTQMSSMGLLPPLPLLLEGTNVTSLDVEASKSAPIHVDGPDGLNSTNSFFDRMDEVNLN